MSKIKYILLGALLMAAFFYNPSERKYYEHIVQENSDNTIGVIDDIKIALIKNQFDYNDYLIYGVLRSKKEDEAAYFGIANMVFGL